MNSLQYYETAVNKYFKIKQCFGPVRYVVVWYWLIIATLNFNVDNVLFWPIWYWNLKVHSAGKITSLKILCNNNGLPIKVSKPGMPKELYGLQIFFFLGPDLQPVSGSLSNTGTFLAFSEKRVTLFYQRIRCISLNYLCIHLDLAKYQTH
jgi:hypothetical protein